MRLFNWRLPGVKHGHYTKICYNKIVNRVPSTRGSKLSQPFKLDGLSVEIPRAAMIPRGYRPGERWAGHVQDILSQMPRQNAGTLQVQRAEFETCEFTRLVVPIRLGENRHWGVHVAHRAKQPGLSPMIDRERAQTNQLSVEVCWNPAGQPLLVRVYPSDDEPPLPWMSSAKRYPGGIGRCLSFWRSHVFVGRHLIKAESEVEQAPSWFVG